MILYHVPKENIHLYMVQVVVHHVHQVITPQIVHLLYAINVLLVIIAVVRVQHL